jgi:predicted membrane protein
MGAGRTALTFIDRIKVCQANKLYHLTAKLIQWAVGTGCIFYVENPQYSFFWQTTFILEVIIYNLSILQVRQQAIQKNHTCFQCGGIHSHQQDV